MMRNNETINFSNESHEVTEASEMRHVLKIKSVTPEDAGDYRVDCLGVLGTSNTAYLRIAGLCYILSNLIFKTVLSSGYILTLLSTENILASLIESCQGWSRMRNAK